MPRQRKAIPTRLEGRSSIAGALETRSQRAAELALDLRKLASLVDHEMVQESIKDLMGIAQTLSNISVGVTLGEVEVRGEKIAVPVEVQLPLVVEEIGSGLMQLQLPFNALIGAEG